MNGVLIGVVIVVAALVLWLVFETSQEQKKNALLEGQMNELRRDLQTIGTAQAQSSGQVSHLVSAVYQDGVTTPGGPAPQVMFFIGGKLAGSSPDASVKSFAQHFRGAAQTNPGGLGGRAACVPGQPSTGGAAVCAWFDNDTFGELVSLNMTASALASELRTIRPSIERPVK